MIARPEMVPLVILLNKKNIHNGDVFAFKFKHGKARFSYQRNSPHHHSHTYHTGYARPSTVMVTLLELQVSGGMVLKVTKP